MLSRVLRLQLADCGNRNSSDDGVLTALLLGPLVSSACLYSSLRSLAQSRLAIPLPSAWLVEAPLILEKGSVVYTAVEAIALSRRNLLDQSTLCSFVLLVHLTASRSFEARHRTKISTPEGERGSVPRSESRRAYLYIAFTLLVTAVTTGVGYVLNSQGIGIWQRTRKLFYDPCDSGALTRCSTADLTYIDIITSSLFYQFTLYSAIRLAHRSFTLGELGFIAFGATVLFMEAFHLTIARVSRGHLSRVCISNYA